MSDNLLLLTPRDPLASPEAATLVHALAAAQFIGAALPERGYFRPGAEFFHFINFLGCSPVVSLGEPGATAEICRIEIPPPLAAPLFVAGENLKPPRCPGCRYRAPEGRDIGAAWERDPLHQRWRCPVCGGDYTAPQLDWRHSAGFGRSFVKIWGVFEGEAVANEALLQVLAEASRGQEWLEFYVQL